MNYQCKARQSEAKSNLGAIRTAQEVYFAEKSTYTDNTSDLAWETRGDTDYTYTLLSGNADGFEAQANADNFKGTESDTWTIDEDGTLTNSPNACE